MYKINCTKPENVHPIWSHIDLFMHFHLDRDFKIFFTTYELIQQV